MTKFRKVIAQACLIGFGINAALVVVGVVTTAGFAMVGLNVGSLVLCYIGWKEFSDD
jgi:hypothetical protein